MNTAQDLSYTDLLREVVPRPIRDKADYRRQLDWIERLMGLPPTQSTSMMIEMLAMTIEAYESTKHPITDAPPDRVLSHLVETSGKSSAAIARDLGMAPSTLSNYCKGRRKMTATRIGQISRYFNVPPTVFYGRNDSLTDHSSVDQRVMESIAALGGEAVTSRQISDHANIPREQVRASLRRLLQSGEVSRSGRVRYALSRTR